MAFLAKPRVNEMVTIERVCRANKFDIGMKMYFAEMCGYAGYLTTSCVRIISIGVDSAGALAE